ncbi:hypothetical protein DL96DRAFT_1619929 [Flagelloscypha sp. PMI_526]|nr:hypothetical protein DL96DRAFT_1619929 [Flagelloscypha sp. PMI_526]
MLLNGYNVWITVDNEDMHPSPMPEYAARVENDRHTSCYIPSAEGKQFSIHWTDTQRRQTAGYCYIDGSSVGGKVIREPWNSNTVKHDAFQLTSTTSTPFRFSKLELTDDDFYLDNTPTKVQSMGVIEVKIYRVIPGQPRQITDASSLPEMTSKIHERSKKGLVHGVAFGGVRQSYVPSTSVDVQFLDQTPIVFTFRYRPIDVLRADGIIPESSDATASSASSSLSKSNPKSTAPKTSASSSSKGKEKQIPTKRKASPVVIDLSDDEDISSLEERLRRAKARKAAALSKSPPAKKVKREAQSSGIVIDLT